MCVAGILQGSQSGVQYERRRYTRAVGEQDAGQALPKTKLWLQTGFRKVTPYVILRPGYLPAALNGGTDKALEPLGCHQKGPVKPLPSAWPCFGRQYTWS